MVDDTLRLEMVSRHIGHVDGDRDDKMRRDGVLIVLGPSRGKVEFYKLAYCRGKSVVSHTIEHACAGGVCGRTSLDSTQPMFD